MSSRRSCETHLVRRAKDRRPSPDRVAVRTPLFDRLDSAIALEHTQVLVTPAATHLGFRVVR
jgi:hypothetical protein